MRWGERGAATAHGPREPHKILNEKLLVQAKLAEAQPVLRAFDKLYPGRGTVVSWSFQVASCIIISSCLPPLCILRGFNKTRDGSMKHIPGERFTYRLFLKVVQPLGTLLTVAEQQSGSLAPKSFARL